MSSTYQQRFLGEPSQNNFKIKPFGQLRLLQVCLNYQGTQSPLNCTIDGDRIREAAKAKGCKDIVTLYDDNSTPLFPSKEQVVKSLIQMLSRCVPGDVFVFQYSGHGDSVNDQDGDQEDGMDEAMCLRTREGEDQYFIDDELAEITTKYLNPKVIFLCLVDACHSGTMLDIHKSIWDDKMAFCISGCQDSQLSNDTGNGGQMTNALLQCLGRMVKKGKRSQAKQFSIQAIFNQMVSKMPQEPQQGQGKGIIEEEQNNFQMEDDLNSLTESEFDRLMNEFEQDWNAYQDEEDAQVVVDDVQPGQWLNLSWSRGTDPTHVPFPL